MAVAFVDSTTGTTAVSGTSHVLSRPGSTATGNLLIARLFTNLDTVPTAPAGWNPILVVGETPDVNSGHSGWWRIAAGGDPSTWTFTTAGSVLAVFGISAWSGHDPDHPIDAVDCVWALSANAVTPAVNARRSGVALCASSKPSTSGDFTIPGTLTSVHPNTAAGVGMEAASGYKAVTAGGVGSEDFGNPASGIDHLTSVIIINEDYTIPTLGSSAFAAAVMALSPAGYWRLADESGLTADDWAGSNDGTYAGMNQLAYGPPIFPGLPASMQLGCPSLLESAGGVYIRPGYVSLPSVDWWSGNANVYSIMACVKANEVNANADRETIFGVSGTAGKPQLEIEADGSLDMIVEGAFRWDSAAGVIAANTPYFIVFTRNGTGNTFHVYVNGAEVTDAAPSTTAQTTGAFVGLIGARTTTTQPWAGFISDVALFTTALSSGQVSSLYALLTGTPSAGEPRFAVPAIIG